MSGGAGPSPSPPPSKGRTPELSRPLRAPAVPLLASISEDILSLLHQETVQRSELLIAELTGVLQLYMTMGTDIFTIARCSQKVGFPPPYPPKQEVVQPESGFAEQGQGRGGTSLQPRITRGAALWAVPVSSVGCPDLVQFRVAGRRSEPGAAGSRPVLKSALVESESESRPAWGALSGATDARVPLFTDPSGEAPE